jgi:predicted RNA-binding protein with PIN domain
VGLRRELGLPSVSGNPGDRVEAELADEGTREPTSTASMAPSSPALLEQYLALPKARLIIDGYNVTKTTWPTLSLEAQRTRLLRLLPGLVARTNAETTVVFDAAASESRPVVASPRGVKVLFSPSGVIADDVIRQLVAAEPAGRVVVVVTADRELATDVRRAGARVVAPGALTRTG